MIGIAPDFCGRMHQRYASRRFLYAGDQYQRTYVATTFIHSPSLLRRNKASTVLTVGISLRAVLVQIRIGVEAGQLLECILVSVKKWNIWILSFIIFFVRFFIRINNRAMSQYSRFPSETENVSTVQYS